MTTCNLMSIPKFAKFTGLNYSLARVLVIRGDVPSVNVGRRRMINEAWARKWVATGDRPLDTPSASV
jgi:hypothetical protein